MLHHYLYGGGQPVLLDWRYFSSSTAFSSFAQSLNVGALAPYVFPQDSDLFFSIGHFTVYRTSDQCYAIHDYYNFDPTSLAHKLYLPLWLLTYVGASDFAVNSSGKL